MIYRRDELQNVLTNCIRPVVMSREEKSNIGLKRNGSFGPNNGAGVVGESGQVVRHADMVDVPSSTAVSDAAV